MSKKDADYIQGETDDSCLWKAVVQVLKGHDQLASAIVLDGEVTHSKLESIVLRYKEKLNRNKESK